MIEETLADIGLSPSEIKVYLNLIKQGSSYANKISSETKINRTNVYEALDRLATKGIISFITKNKVKWFGAKPPGSILSLLHEQEDHIKKITRTIARELKEVTPFSKKPLEAQIFVGKNGLRMIFEEMLHVKKPISFIAAELQFKALFGPYFELWHKKRIAHRIEQRSIFPQKMKKHLPPRKFLQYAFVDDRYTNPTTTIIYGTRCVLIQWTDEPLAIRLDNKEIAQSHRNHFNLLWNAYY